jgi:Nitroreductase
MNYLELLEKRYASKAYKETLLTEGEENLILEYARLTPSSFGLEAWHVVAVSRRTAPELFPLLTKCCFNQYSVSSAPFFTALCYNRSKAFEKGSEFIKKRAMRFDGGVDVFENDFRGFYETLEPDSWSRAQVYLMAMNMASGASSIAIESCIIEGFDETETAKALNVDLSEYGIGLVIPFGHPADSMKDKIRIGIEELVTKL